MALVRELEARITTSGVSSFAGKMKSARSNIDAVADEAEGAAGSMNVMESATGDVGSEAIQASAGVSFLESRIEKLGDKLTGTGLQATMFGGAMTGAAGASTAFAAATTGASLAATGLKASLIGIGVAAIPALLGPLTIATGALTGFAGAIGLVLGSGFLAWSNKSGNSLEKVVKQIKNIVIEFGSQFIPLINRAVNVLPDFVYEVLQATGNLKPFVNALRDMGAAAFDIIPKLVQFFFQLGREALPILRRFGAFIMKNLIPALRGAKNQTDELGPKFIKFGQAVGKLLPKLFKLSNWVLNTFVPVATSVVNWTNRAINTIGDLGSAFTGVKQPAQGATNKITGVRQAVRQFESATSSGASTMKTEFKNALNSMKQHLDTFASGLQTLANGEWKKGFQTLGQVSRTAFTDLRRFLVGEDGNGGMMNQMIREAGSFLRTEGNQILFAASEEAWKSIINRAKNLKIMLIGSSGSGGLINTMIGEIATYLKSDAFKTLLKAATKALGKGIRTAAIDVYNAIIGKEPSIIGDMIREIFTYLQTDAYGDLKEAATILFDALIVAAEGLYDGLIGNSLIPEMIGDIVSYLKRDAAGDLKSAGKAMMNSFKRGIENKVSSVTGAVDDVVQDVRDLLPGSDAKKGPLSSLTDAGASLPETFADAILRNKRPVEHAVTQVAQKSTPDPKMSVTPAQARGDKTVNYNVSVSVAKGVDVDTAARTFTDEMKSHNFN